MTDTDTATVDVVNPGLDIVKTGPTQAREGDTVTYDFAVHNTGDISLSGIVRDRRRYRRHRDRPDARCRAPPSRSS